MMMKKDKIAELAKLLSPIREICKHEVIENEGDLLTEDFIAKKTEEIKQTSDKVSEFMFALSKVKLLKELDDQESALLRLYFGLSKVEKESDKTVPATIFNCISNAAIYALNNGAAPARLGGVMTAAVELEIEEVNKVVTTLLMVKKLVEMKPESELMLKEYMAIHGFDVGFVGKGAESHVKLMSLVSDDKKCNVKKAQKVKDSSGKTSRRRKRSFGEDELVLMIFDRKKKFLRAVGFPKTGDELESEFKDDSVLDYISRSQVEAAREAIKNDEKFSCKASGYNLCVLSAEEYQRRQSLRILFKDAKGNPIEMIDWKNARGRAPGKLREILTKEEISKASSTARNGEIFKTEVDGKIIEVASVHSIEQRAARL